MTATSTLQGQDSIFTFGGESPISVSGCREATAAESDMSFGWSDIPCHGGYTEESLSAYPSLPQLEVVSSDDEDEEFEDKTEMVFDNESMMSLSWTSQPSSTYDAHLRKMDREAPSTTSDASLPSPFLGERYDGNLRRRRRVRFGTQVEIREHNVILGDHPMARGGMALQCDWSHNGSSLHVLDDYERRSSKRRGAELRLDYGERRQRLEEFTGMSAHDLFLHEFELCREAS